MPGSTFIFSYKQRLEHFCAVIIATYALFVVGIATYAITTHYNFKYTYTAIQI